MWLLVVLSGCGERPADLPVHEAPQTGPVDGDMLVVGIPFDPGNANPLVIPYALSFEITDLVVPGLVRRRPGPEGLTFEPALARSWSWSDDGAALTYALRDDLLWEDGTALTSADVAFSFELLSDPVVASNWLGDARFVTAVETPDPRTVVYRFDRARNPVLQQARTTRGVVPVHRLREVDRGTLRGHESARSPLASGPWRVATWDVEQRIVLEPNPRAPAEWHPHLERVVVRILPEYSARLLELERGSLDLVAGVEIDDLARLEADPRLRVARVEAGAMQYVGYNLSTSPFDDRAVRRALTLATDRQRLIEDLLTAGGTTYGQPCVGTVSPRLDAWVPEDLKPLPHDRAEAAMLLEASGWTDVDGDGVRERDGVPLRTSLMVQTGEAALKRIAVLVQAQWKLVGVDLQIEMVEPTRFSQRAREKDFEAILWSFGGSPVVDPSIQWRSDGQYNWFGYADPETDRLIDAGLAAADLDVARTAFHEVQRRVHEAQPATFLFWQDEVVVLDRRFRDTDLDSYSSLRHAERWWVPREEQRY